MNGRKVTEKVLTKHGDRILLGNNHLFRLSCPRQQGDTGDQVQLMSYEQAMNEISAKELRDGMSHCLFVCL